MTQSADASCEVLCESEKVTCVHTFDVVCWIFCSVAKNILGGSGRGLYEELQQSILHVWI